VSIEPADIERALAGSFPGDLGIEVLDIGSDRARAQLKADARHLHPGGYVHGGVWASLADTVAAWGTIANLGGAADFSTAEMKMNVFGTARSGDVLEAEASALHLGRRTHVWEVRVSVGERLGALFVCTQVLVATPAG
jgi:1,4-dihydroxy-2-naphthoyl-CoA hydrolase